jgi:hypothetical protein
VASPVKRWRGILKVKTFVRRTYCSNDYAKRNFRLSKDLVNGYKNENMKQNLKLGTTERS